MNTGLIEAEERRRFAMFTYSGLSSMPMNFRENKALRTTIMRRARSGQDVGSGTFPEPDTHMAIARPGLLVLCVCLLLVLKADGSQTQETFSGEVVGVTDGDTISVMRNGEAARVRLEGVDCPEEHQEFSQSAKEFTSVTVFGKVVAVEVRDVDRYGRLVARVIHENQDLSLALVRQGLAWHYKEYSSDSVLADAESQARAARLGIWSQPAPIPPWDFRRAGSVPHPSSDGPFHGNRRSRVFHRPGCPNYECTNCTEIFQTREEAIEVGFRPAGDCH